MPVAQQLFQDAGGGAELVKFTPGQGIEMGREILDSALASLLEKARAFGGSADAHAACVVGIASDFNQAAAFESGDDAAHGGRLDLLGGGEFAERLRTGKDEHGERGQACRTFAGGYVLPPRAAEQVDGGGMKAVGRLECLRSGCDVLGLDFCHRI